MASKARAQANIIGADGNIKLESLTPVDSDRLADGSVTSAKIVDATIDSADLAANAISTLKIQDDAIHTDKLIDSAVHTAKIQDGAVTAAKIDPAKVTQWDSAYGWGDHSLEGYATETYVDSEINAVIGGAPGALDTLNELAAALNDDATFSTTVTNSLALKAPLASPALTGTPTAPTAAESTNTTQIATTAYVQTELSNIDTNLVSDTTPQLGGTLDANGNTIDMGTNNITDSKVGQWDTAYGWGDHSASGYITDVVNDTTPQLGGNLDLNSNNITGTGNVNITGTVTATSYSGDGSSLTGITTDPYDSATSSTGFFAMPAGTTAQRPGSLDSDDAGYTRFNTTTGSLEFFNGENWVATNLIPTVDSVTGTIYAGAASNLTVSATNATDTVTVRFIESGSIVADVADVDMSTGSASVSVPAAVYGQTGGDTIAVSVLNSDGTPSSNSVNKTVQATPTGGTITTYSTYRVHTFTSSGSFVVPSGLSLTYDILRVAGGGAGGGHGGNDGAGGGGAGGMLVSTGVSLSAATYTATVGGGGSGVGGATTGTNGSNTTFTGLTNCIGGGGGGTEGAAPRIAGSGGSGGGAGGFSGSRGSGTAGQGNDGGAVNGSGSSGGGGGAGAAGSNVGVGGIGLQNAFRTGSNQYYAGGGGGSGDDRWQIAGGAGGAGGGGTGASDIHGQANQAGSGSANTGGGGGGAAGSTNSVGVTSGAGGSGIIVVRYQL